MIKCMLSMTAYRSISLFICIILIICSFTDIVNVVSSQVNKPETIPLISFCTGLKHACAVTSSKAVKCWGQSLAWGSGFEGVGDSSDELGDMMPFINVGNGASVDQVSCGSYHVCMKLETGDMKCLGQNREGQVGIGLESSGLPIGFVNNYIGDNLPIVNVGTGLQVVEVVLGDFHSCVLVTGNKVKCFGLNKSGQLGYGDTTNRGSSSSDMGDNLSFIDFGTNVEVASLHSSSASAHTCIILSGPSENAQRAKCWGSNTSYQLGYSDQDNRGDDSGEMGDDLLLIDFGTESRVKQLSLGLAYTCALLTNDDLRCFGMNYYSVIGSGSTDAIISISNSLSSITIDSGNTIKIVKAGFTHTCIVYDDLATMKCVGSNDNGQLGQGDTLKRGDTPETMIPFTPAIQLGTGNSLSIVSIQIGNDFCCLVFDDSSVKCFGLNDNGQLAIGSTNNVGDEPNEMGDNLQYATLAGTPPQTSLPTNSPSFLPTNSPTFQNSAPTKSPYIGRDPSLYAFRDDIGSLTWVQAEAKCQELYNGHLATISTEGEAQYLTSLANGKDYWIGLNDRASEGTFVWAFSSLPLSYTNWEPNEPANSVDADDCVVVMSNGNWNDGICNYKAAAFACDVPRATSAVPTFSPTALTTKPAYTGRDPSEFIYRDNLGLLTWLEAESICQTFYNGHLITITNADETEYITSLANGGFFYVGLNDQTTEGTFEWVSGLTLNYTNWYPGEPNDDIRRENCVEANEIGLWIDIPCENYQVSGFACELTTQSPTNAPVTTSTIPPTVNFVIQAPTTAPVTSTPTIPGPTISPSITPTTGSPFNVPTQLPTQLPTNAPIIQKPTISPSIAPTTGSPFNVPTQLPTQLPTNAPIIQKPTLSPTDAPTTGSPLNAPTNRPTQLPSRNPTLSPTDAPTPPTPKPTKLPSTNPTQSPTNVPTTKSPTSNPTRKPTQSFFGTNAVSLPGGSVKAFDLFLLIDSTKNYNDMDIYCQQYKLMSGSPPASCMELLIDYATEIVKSISNAVGGYYTNDLSKGLRVQASIFKCIGSKFDPEVELIIPFTGDSSIIMNVLTAARTKISLTEKGSCPIRGIYQMIQRVENEWSNVDKRPFRSLITLTNALMTDESRYILSKTITAGVNAISAIRYRCTPSIVIIPYLNDANTPSAQQQQISLKIFTGNIDASVFEAKNAPWIVIPKIGEQITSLLLPLSTNTRCTSPSSFSTLDRYWCGYNTRSACTPRTSCQWSSLVRTCSKLSLLTGCKTTTQSTCIANTICQWKSNTCIRKAEEPDCNAYFTSTLCAIKSDFCSWNSSTSSCTSISG